MLVGTFCVVLSVKHGKLREKHVYMVSQNMSTHQKVEKMMGAKSRLGEKIATVLLVLAAFKTLGQFNVFPF
jgi:hypothetical protein